MKLKLYLETSLFGFFFDENVFNKEKRNDTKTLFMKIKSGEIDGFISPMTEMELMRVPTTYRERMLNLISKYKIQRIEYSESEVKEIERLVDRIIRKNILLEKSREDAVHLANVAVKRNEYFLVSWNCRHIVNVNTKMRLNTLLKDEGYYFDIQIYTPSEVIYG